MDYIQQAGRVVDPAESVQVTASRQKPRPDEADVQCNVEALCTF